MFVIEIESAAPPLRPGERGMKTNGPVDWWYRVNNIEWIRCARSERSGYQLKEKILRILEGESDGA